MAMRAFVQMDLHVGLPEGQMGNSEVGHMNLGAGRIVYQDLAKINLAVTNDTIKDETVLKGRFTICKKNQKAVHLLGLVSDGGVHSHLNHLYGFLDVIEDHGVEKSFIHAFTDGRDVDPKSGLWVYFRTRNSFRIFFNKTSNHYGTLLCYGS